MKTKGRQEARFPQILREPESLKAARESDRRNAHRHFETDESHNQAIRALGRHLCRVIFKMLDRDRSYRIDPLPQEPTNIT